MNAIRWLQAGVALGGAICLLACSDSVSTEEIFRRHAAPFILDGATNVKPSYGNIDVDSVVGSYALPPGTTTESALTQAERLGQDDGWELTRRERDFRELAKVTSGNGAGVEIVRLRTNARSSMVVGWLQVDRVSTPEEAVRSIEGEWAAKHLWPRFEALVGDRMPPRPAAQFRWNTGAQVYECVLNDEYVGDAQHQSLTITTPGGVFRRPPYGAFLEAMFLELLDQPGNQLLVTQWTGGASTYNVVVYQIVGGRVREVLRSTTSTSELGVLDVDNDGRPDIVVSERGGEGAMMPSEMVAYLWRGTGFERSQPIRWPLIPPAERRIGHDASP
jgi:hypothetical protein